MSIYAVFAVALVEAATTPPAPTLSPSTTTAYAYTAHGCRQHLHNSSDSATTITQEGGKLRECYYIGGCAAGSAVALSWLHRPSGASEKVTAFTSTPQGSLQTLAVEGDDQTFPDTSTIILFYESTAYSNPGFVMTWSCTEDSVAQQIWPMLLIILAGVCGFCGFCLCIRSVCNPCTRVEDEVKDESV